MREIVKDLIKIITETLPIKEPIYEFGSYQVEGQESFADLRPFFKNKKYIGADIRKGPGVDIILDLHNINLPSNSVGTVICVDTLEHVEFPRKAINEIFRILDSDGIVILTTVMNFPIHDYPYDYWRFTPEGLKSLLKIFPKYFVDYIGEENFPHTIIGIGFKNSEIKIKKFQEELKKWQDEVNVITNFDNIKIKNLYKDGWLGESALIQFLPLKPNIKIFFEIYLPEFVKEKNPKLYLFIENLNKIYEINLKHGLHQYELEINSLKKEQVTIKLFPNYTFIPYKINCNSTDKRILSAIIKNIKIQ